MIFDLLTLFPGMFAGPFTESIIRRAADRSLVTIRLHNIRDYATDRHRTVDDAPYGGGAGMVMKVEPLATCLDRLLDEKPTARLVLTTPRGVPLSQRLAAEYAGCSRLIIICGRYEGIDERVRELYGAEEVSLGDFVLSGGEIAAMAIVDAVTRLVPGALGSPASAGDDSFADGLLEYPHFTRPPEFRGLNVPEVLLAGNHGDIARWRRRESLRKTWQVRPDMLDAAVLSQEDRDYLHLLAEDRDTWKV